MPWAIEWDEKAADDLATLEPPVQRRIRNYIAPADDPRALGHALRGDLGELWRYRVGDFHLLGHIEDEKLVVLVVEVGHRREIYR